MTKICTDCGHRRGLHKRYRTLDGNTYLQCLGEPPAERGYLSKCKCCVPECFFEEKNLNTKNSENENERKKK